ncbi:hypothetical protein GCM10023320_59580 [Pseudonocardia adelaidensis]|uniref:Uncharacterized protein n=1 Tax=Pseudonocardia adelaidensis TaxID=648754 RepID=A0ABP9NT30_9PSEU
MARRYLREERPDAGRMIETRWGGQRTAARVTRATAGSAARTAAERSGQPDPFLSSCKYKGW